MSFRMVANRSTAKVRSWSQNHLNLGKSIAASALLPISARASGLIWRGDTDAACLEPFPARFFREAQTLQLAPPF